MCVHVDVYHMYIYGCLLTGWSPDCACVPWSPVGHSLHRTHTAKWEQEVLLPAGLWFHIRHWSRTTAWHGHPNWSIVSMSNLIQFNSCLSSVQFLNMRIRISSQGECWCSFIHVHNILHYELKDSKREKRRWSFFMLYMPMYIIYL